VNGITFCYMQRRKELYSGRVIESIERPISWQVFNLSYILLKMGLCHYQQKQKLKTEPILTRTAGRWIMKETESRIRCWYIVAVGLLLVLTRPVLASTAVDDFYSIDISSGSREHLVVAYNDTIFLDSEEAALAAKIIDFTSIDPAIGTLAINTDDNLSFDFRPVTGQQPATVTFRYTLQDIRGTSEAQVTLSLGNPDVQGVNANDDAYVSSGDVVLLYPIENDRIGTGSNATGATISFEAIDASQGRIEVQSAAAILYM